MNSLTRAACRAHGLRQSWHYRSLNTKKSEQEPKPKPKLPTVQGDTEFVHRRRAHRKIMHHSRIAFQEEVRKCEVAVAERKETEHKEIQEIKAETRRRK